MTYNYEVFVGDVAENAQIITQIWLRSFDLLQTESAQQKLQHSYFTNPAGAGPAFLLRETVAKNIVGVQGLVMREFCMGDTVMSAGIIADYAVDPAHRTLLPALQLLKLCVAKSADFAGFLYGFPNHKAEAITKRVGFEQVMQLERFAVPLRIEHYLPRQLPSWVEAVARVCGDFVLAAIGVWRWLRFARRVTWTMYAPSESIDVDAIWNAAVAKTFLLSKRSHDVLGWRYRLATAANGQGQWRLDVAREGEELIGYVAWSLRDGIAVVGDFLCADPVRHTATLMVAFQRLARRSGASAISIEYCGNSEVERALCKAGFFAREGSPLYMFKKESLPPAERWYFTGFDRDTD